MEPSTNKGRASACNSPQSGVAIPPPDTRWFHRPSGYNAMALMHVSRDLGADRKETAIRPITCIGIQADASSRSCFVQQSGPTEWSWQRPTTGGRRRIGAMNPCDFAVRATPRGPNPSYLKKSTYRIRRSSLLNRGRGSRWAPSLLRLNELDNRCSGIK